MESKAQMALDQAINEIENEWGYEGIKEEMYEIMKPILKDLEHLEAIDNAKPSEALKCSKNNSELFDKIAKENPTTYKNETFAEAFLFKTNTIKIEQALLKAQEQDKILDILKRKIKVYPNGVIYLEDMPYEECIKIKEWLENE